MKLRIEGHSLHVSKMGVPVQGDLGLQAVVEQEVAVPLAGLLPFCMLITSHAQMFDGSDPLVSLMDGVEVYARASGSGPFILQKGRAQVDICCEEVIPVLQSLLNVDRSRYGRKMLSDEDREMIQALIDGDDETTQRHQERLREMVG